MASFYGTLVNANNYFGTRLHTSAWDDASTSDRQKALYMATRYIDRLNYKGDKASVYTLLAANAEATDTEIRVADASQELEFPRDTDTTIPNDIETACYEITLALLDGVDPDAELENLGISTHSYAGVRTAYNRDQQPIEHLIHGIPSALAWRYLKPFLRDGREYRITRVS
jgi:hypothetical protein